MSREYIGAEREWMKGTVVALGGGGFSMSDSGLTSIDKYILELTGESRPKVCFIPTASGDASSYAHKFEAAFGGYAETSVLSLFCQQPWGYTDPRSLLDQDIVYVGGGSTANLLAIWRLHGLPEILEEAAGVGTVLAGISAGMNCWFESSSTDSFGPLAPLNDGLGFIPGSACPHYFGEPGRREKYLQWVGEGILGDGFAVDEYCALVMKDGIFDEAIAERPGHPAYRVIRQGHAGIEADLPVRLLGRPIAGSPSVSSPDGRAT